MGGRTTRDHGKPRLFPARPANGDARALGGPTANGRNRRAHLPQRARVASRLATVARMERAYSGAFESLRDVYLEDSWVLAIQPSSPSLAFDLDVVLTPSHPNYRGARPGEQHDYRRARLV